MFSHLHHAVMSVIRNKSASSNVGGAARQGVWLSKYTDTMGFFTATRVQNCTALPSADVCVLFPYYSAVGENSILANCSALSLVQYKDSGFKIYCQYNHVHSIEHIEMPFHPGPAWYICKSTKKRLWRKKKKKKNIESQDKRLCINNYLYLKYSKQQQKTKENYYKNNNKASYKN